jgi:hypothetical protein
MAMIVTGTIEFTDTHPELGGIPTMDFKIVEGRDEGSLQLECAQKVVNCEFSSEDIRSSFMKAFIELT